MHIEISGITGSTILLTFVGSAIFLILILSMVPRPRSTREHARKSLLHFLSRWF